ncbi:helix-turn-helix transcriptional regulator [Geobacter pickeringii]|uniref:Helix-turn-helix domain-containing protein n=1 Tax=Geobacter pickeringii TaxID=345632 RepID=A0A0B5BEL2_9BACT|nr:helix-turn-helix domain-containing protein [Geobacter pickeringii]AJE03599.1 hypothetical protein GPICK_09760 [Geobacter pickeringii]
MADVEFELVDVAEFARRMGVSRSTVFDWLARGRFTPGWHYLRVGKTLRFIWTLERLQTLTGDVPVEGEQGEEPQHSFRKSAINMEF